MTGRQENAILVGRIHAPHGIAGLVSVESFSDNPARFADGAVVRDAAGTPLVVEHSAEHKGRLLIKFSGVADRNAAEQLRGRDLFVSEQETPPLPAGVYYHYQIIGCQVFENGSRLGEITDILNYSANDIYVMRRDDGTQTLIPALKSVVTAIDPAAKRIDVVLPEGL